MSTEVGAIHLLLLHERQLVMMMPVTTAEQEAKAESYGRCKIDWGRHMGRRRIR